MAGYRYFITMLVGVLSPFVLQAVVLVPLTQAPEGQEALSLLEATATLAALEEAEVALAAAAAAGRLGTLATEGPVAILAAAGRMVTMATQGPVAAVAAEAAEVFPFLTPAAISIKPEVQAVMAAGFLLLGLVATGRQEPQGLVVTEAMVATAAPVLHMPVPEGAVRVQV